MDNYYTGHASPNDFSEGQQQHNGQDEMAMGRMNVENQGFSGASLQQAMSGNTSPVASGGLSSHADTVSAELESAQGTSNQQQQQQQRQQNMGNMGNMGSMANMGNMSNMSGMMQNADLNNFQFNPQTVMGQHFMPDFQGQQGQQQGAPQQQSQQQQNNIMSQLMFQNAYANMLQNQSIAMRMNPNAMHNFNLDLSDPNVVAAVKNNMASLNLQNQMLSNMAMAPNMMQNMSMGTSDSSAANNNANSQQVQGMHNQNNMQHRQQNTNPHRPAPLNTASLAQGSPAHYSQPSSPAFHSGHQSSHGESPQRRASMSQSRPDSISHNPQQNQMAQTLFMQQPGSENMAQPAFGVGQGDVSNVNLGNANPFPSAVKLNQNSYRDAYSSTGFDMLTVLMRVATRKDPIINIGAVDLSCAFVVCDVLQHDIPIVYCSDNFERLTGYTKHEILGRNCRFLQSPSGHVSAGVKRKYADDDTVLHLKNTTNARKEAQVSVINYRKGGQPFMNLLTMIPVSYSDGEDIQFYVGFQVDLVEQPHSVTSQNSDGTYTVNYQRGLTMPRYVFTEKDQPAPISTASQTISRDEVSTVLATVGSGDSELSKRIWDKVLLENTDDVVFVLSLKGLFLYLSPSSSRVLEYDPSELTSTAISSVCHPSDIVPVTRELKETANGATVSVVFRIRRKISGYMWFEAHGSLYTEQGKGRKSIVLVGRERPVYTLKEPDIVASGGYGENEVWTKLSTSGMFLFVSSSMRSLIDKQPHELVGTSIQSLMRPDSRAEFGRILEIARSGRRAQTRHELLNRRGQVLQAFSTLYPGDASEGTKPTFFVAQTRLLKYNRQSTGNQSSAQAGNAPATQHESTEAFQQGAPADPSRTRANLARSVSSVGSAGTPNHMMSTFETISTHAGQDSLPLGNQGEALAHEANMFDELKTTRSTSWQFELRQMERHNRLLAEELQRLLAARKKRKRRKGAGVLEKECANCHTKQTPEWRRGPSGNRDLCNSCGLRWAKQQGRISPRTSGHRSAKSAASGRSAKSEKSGGGSPRSQSGGHSAGHPGGASGSAGAESGGGESRSIDETLAQSVQQGQRMASTGSGAESAGSNVRMSEAVGDTQTVSKAAKAEDTSGQGEGDMSQTNRLPGHGLTVSTPTKVEDN